MNLIKNINYITFSAYGAIEHNGFHHAAAQLDSSGQCRVQEKSANIKEIRSLFVFDQKVVLDNLSGITLLYVVISPEEAGDFFLLDKTVVINEGILFNVVSLYGSCGYRICEPGTGSIHQLPTPVAGPMGLSSSIHITKIHTLFYQEKEKGFSFKGESHAFWELTYIDKGKMYSRTEDQTLLLQQGDVVFYRCGEHHSQWCDTDALVSFITITFDMDFSAPELAGKVHSVDSEMKTLLSKILSERENNSVYSEDMILCYLKEFIIRLVRNQRLEKAIIEQESPIRIKIDDTILTKCLEYIENNIDNKISVPDVARSIPISASYLSAIFRRKMNTSIIDYINNFRLEKGKELIKTGSLNFTQISEKLGYTSVHYFSRQFKAKYGVSPSEFARSIMK